jgi:formate hydrogenlyase subunit 3/multisubunit Na+/H+ antiporter MnhD subunit
MGLISSIYLAIFLPLVAAIFCQIFSQKKLSFLLAFLGCLAVFFLVAKAFLAVLIYNKISNDFELSPISLGLEFKLDLLGTLFLLLVIFIKTVALFFYRQLIAKILDKKTHIFYAVFSLQLFALVGIFTTNNLFNLFLFCEIYCCAIFAIFAILRDLQLSKLALRYFYLNVVSSLLFLFCFFVIYLAFGEVNFDKIAENIPLIFAENFWFLAAIFGLFVAAIIMKFFGFWLHFQKLKSSNVIANFLAIDALFIKTSIGIFLLLKFVYFVFGTQMVFSDFGLKSWLIFLASSLVIFSSYKIYSQNHLKQISAYFCLNNLGFALVCVALQSFESFRAMFFYLLNFGLLNLAVFIFASFLEQHFATSSLDKICLIGRPNFLLKFLIFFVAAFPLTILFFANWYLTFASFKFGFEALILLALLLSNFVYAALAIKLIKAFFSKNYSENSSEILPSIWRKKVFYLTLFWFLVAIICGATLSASWLNEISLSFASYLFANAIY